MVTFLTEGHRLQPVVVVRHTKESELPWRGPRAVVKESNCPHTSEAELQRQKLSMDEKVPHL
jgi:hypothetical protein